MANRRGRGSKARRPKDSYGQERHSDRSYLKESRSRVRAETQRRWGVRLIVVALLGLAVWLWGKVVVQWVVDRGKSTAYRTQQVGEGVRGKTDERTGAGFTFDD